jgi:hypothetical protein
MESVMTKKEIVYIQDQNGGAYNGTITFETSSISNSGKFQDLTNSFIVIPYVVQFTAPADLNGEINRFCLGMKSGWWQLLHAMSVDLNGISIIQLSSFLNLYASYKCMTSWSYNDLWKNGESVGFWKDSVDSFRYLAAVGVGGIGATNNTIQQIGAAAGGLQQLSVTGTGNWNVQTIAYGYNEGLLRRCLANSYVFNGDGVAPATDATAFLTVDQASQVGLCYHGRTAAAGNYYWRYNAVIRLRDISDFFDNKVPLHRGGVYRFTINYNACNMTVTCSAVGGTLTPSVVVQTAGQTTPWVFSSNALNNPNALLGARALPIVSGINISGASGSASISSCRLYIPLYTLNEAYEEQLLSLNPEKTIQYKDIYQYTISNTAANGSFNALVTNGLAKPLTVILIPFDSTGYSGVSSLTTPFSSTPSTTDPYMLVRNFNVQVSGINIFQQNVDFSWLEFQAELSKINAVNGNCTPGLTSGLISQHDYERGYCYVVADLSRQYSADDFVPKSILVSGTNASNKPVTYYVFVEYMRTITINLASGNVRL